MWRWVVVTVAFPVLVCTLLITWLVVSGRRESVRAVAGLVPDFVVLFRRLLGDARVPRRRKLLLAAVVPYLAMPFDLVPDFIPVLGQLDDAVIVAFVLRRVLRGAGPELIVRALARARVDAQSRALASRPCVKNHCVREV